MMKILVYCQHVLGIGHLMRTFEILKELREHEVTLMLGGPELTVPVPDHVSIVQLPPLEMDTEFSGLKSSHGDALEKVKQKRTEAIIQCLLDVQPDILLIELYPFGRNGFHFELEPLLLATKERFPACLIASSVRDILVDRDNTKKFEQRVIDRMNSFFDLLLIHGDPEVIRLDETFSRMGEIRASVVYSGYVNRPITSDRKELLDADDEQPPLIVASAGSGVLGLPIFKAAILARQLIEAELPTLLHVYTGPYFEKKDFEYLQELSTPGCSIKWFCDDLPAELKRAALSISMGGYNTTMDIITAGCPALISPFAQNHEQRLRAERMRKLAPIELLEPEELEPERLATLMLKQLKAPYQKPAILLNGAVHTRDALIAAAEEKQKG